ncbi:D-alanyl-D-alanine dipeptidase [Rhizocola hellebori]|uniref:D-alanyl-D-alanine dipeptidase n=1 Tax=Rhizocola hellebori TaxID=1392758 RepID=A0A8J3Q4V0_9ACTN|nr:M15 family metallopeptidase [Rhizocola hellebori]GIH03839.1 D-alanyl-D-alanine dipeptidase [Rhizocola hellebori]
MDMVVLSDPEVVGIPVVECGEPLIDVRKIAALRVDGRLADPQGCFARLRVGMVDRLVTAQTLLPAGLRFLIVEGYRPAELQKQYFDAFVHRLRVKDPAAAEADLRRRAARYISPPEVAPHVAGAAVDVTLCTVYGAELAMGTEVNDTDTTACHTDSTEIDARAIQNRRLLGAALSAAGLVNYPSEWWHWSYGDRYWAYVSGAGHACYGPAEV